MSPNPYATLPKPKRQLLQRGRKANKGLLQVVHPSAPPAHLDEYSRAIWNSITQDPRFVPTTANLATACVAMEALAVIRHMGDRMRDVKKDTPRSVYEIHSRAIKSYCDALDLLGVRNAH